jgi:hypothetical protein
MSKTIDELTLINLMQDFEEYLDLKDSLSSNKIKLICELIRKEYQNYIEKLNDRVGDFIEIKREENKRQLEIDFEERIIKEKSLLKQRISERLKEEFELDYELKLNNLKKEYDNKFLDKSSELKKTVEELYKNKYDKNKQEIIDEIQPVIENKYRVEFENKKQEYIEEAYSKIENEYQEKFRRQTKIYELETAIDYALKYKTSISLYNDKYNDELKKKLYKEMKDDMYNNVLFEVKKERAAFKENCQAQLEAERKMLELDLREELLKSKKRLKIEADKYIQSKLAGKSKF